MVLEKITSTIELNSKQIIQLAKEEAARQGYEFISATISAWDTNYQGPGGAKLTMVVRTPDPKASAPSIGDELAAIDSDQPWGPGYESVRDPEQATHVWAKSIGVQKLPCAYPRSMDLRWLRAR